MRMLQKLFSIVVLFTGLVWVGCTGSGGSSSSSSNGSYAGPGSKWTAEFTDGSFVVRKYANAAATSPDVTVNGDYEELSTGFRKLTVTSATGTGAPSSGVEAYGLDIPGLAFFLKPAGDANSEPIVMVKSGDCPTANFTGNWIAADFEAGTTTDDTQDAFGTASFTINGASSSANIVRLTFETGTTLSPNSLSFDSANCSGGVLDVGGGVEMYLTTAGAALVKTPGSKIFAAPAGSSAVTQSDLAGTYSAIAFVSDNPSQKQIPVKLVIPTSGTATATEIDVDTDAPGSGSVDFSSFTAVSGSPGLFTATATMGSDTGKINCATFTYNSVKVIGCNGFFKTDASDYDSDANTTEKVPFFFLGRAR